MAKKVVSKKTAPPAEEVKTPKASKSTKAMAEAGEPKEKKAAPRKKKAESEGEPAAKKKAAPRKTAKKRSSEIVAREVRLKAFWGVYSQTFQLVKLFPYADREAAEVFAAEMTEAKKTPHFIRLEKQVIDE